MVIEAQSLGLISIRVREASGCVMHSQLNVKRPTCGGATAIRIKVECLRCGHCGALDETDLPRFGVKSGAPLVVQPAALRMRSQSSCVIGLPSPPDTSSPRSSRASCPLDADVQSAGGLLSKSNKHDVMAISERLSIFNKSLP
jgi:hypothetical protein